MPDFYVVSLNMAVPVVGRLSATSIISIGGMVGLLFLASGNAARRLRCRGNDLNLVFKMVERLPREVVELRGF